MGKPFLEDDVRNSGLKNLVDSDYLIGSVHSVGSDMGSDSVHSQMCGSSMDVFRVSGGTCKVDQSLGAKVDAVLPKALESVVMLDVQQVACGGRHAALVTKQGEVFCWGEESGERLGHGVDTDVAHPQLVEALASTNIEFVACGSTWVPREVDSLKGLRTIRVACGMWHSAAIVEVMVGSSSSSNCSLGKLFTWGDGDKGRRGHGDKEQKLVPTCVAALVEHNFCNVSCGHSLTVGLTLSGQVFMMGSTVYGQLGDPHADGKVPKRVEGKLRDVFVEEGSCGAFHLAVLTSKGEVFTWGKGANGRLGHGDFEDRKVPTLVEALKDKQVKSIACGTSITAAICLHKWVSGADHSVCSGCKQPFGFTRKRHNCYNCGLVYCHSCSSKKAMKASMAPNPSKPYRVCDPCYMKLKKAADNSLISNTGLVNRKMASTRPPVDNRDRRDRWDSKLPRSQPAVSKSTGLEQLKLNEYIAYSKKNRRPESTSSRVSPIRSGPSQHNAYKLEVHLT
ncbi:hypothetical protein L7F22_020660 [Adiantum nelumboides]|nr:hypothetical protein [Adiantum nelumboides]